tara:strand:- start:505 stop:708 length:204 start_codon:yes stop_codon:yes gene_type:complete
MNCQHCNEPNPENWFYCRECGKRASAPKWTINSWVMSEMGKRTDMEFSETTVDESMKKMQGAINATR